MSTPEQIRQLAEALCRTLEGPTPIGASVDEYAEALAAVWPQVFPPVEPVAGGEFTSAEYFHPGEYVKEEMEHRGWSIDAMCERTGIVRSRLEPILNGKARLLMVDCYCIGRAFGTSATTWRNLQAAFDKKPTVHATALQAGEGK